jgi:hypothetical protein
MFQHHPKLRMTLGRTAAPGFFAARKQRAWSIESFASEGPRANSGPFWRNEPTLQKRNSGRTVEPRGM